MKSAQYFSFSKSSIGFKPITYSVTRRQITPTGTAKSSSNSACGQSSSHVTATRFPTKTVESHPASRDLVVPLSDLALPRLEQSRFGPSLARTAGFQPIGQGNVLGSFILVGFRPIGRGNTVGSFLRE